MQDMNQGHKYYQDYITALYVVIWYLFRHTFGLLSVSAKSYMLMEVVLLNVSTCRYGIFTLTDKADTRCKIYDSDIKLLNNGEINSMRLLDESNSV